MKSISGLGLGLCVVFGSLLLALIAELYYLLWWKKKKIITTTAAATTINEAQIQIPRKRSNFSYILHFCQRPSSSSLRSAAHELCNSPTLVHEPQSSNSSSKDLWLRKPFAEENMGNFPRFLFTITEETREDLESEDGVFKKASRSNLSDLLQILETPFLTPMASPPYFTPPLTPSFCEGESPFWECAEFRRRASPPPAFKFLRDAEEKMAMRERGDERESEGNGQFITLVIDEKDEGRDGIGIKNCSLEEDECFSSSRFSSQR
ncbi:uncharacterized protein LOC131005981 [Salvia miltiorrhiza]|uniref:uncharacterized protein LOC131005981 n=1 Tax=Salvia miltiorrhiza TaxID=226208 RepID=UPI0025ACB609|nr:uncharacterized protein LOC131005981 [Salvia miltiorrhiza]